MLNLNIKATGIELSGETSDYLRKKISALEKFVSDNDTGAMANVEVGRETNHHKTGNVYFTEINFRIGNKDFRARSSGDSIISSTNRARDVAVEELRKEKDKKVS